MKRNDLYSRKPQFHLLTPELKHLREWLEGHLEDARNQLEAGDGNEKTYDMARGKAKFCREMLNLFTTPQSNPAAKEP
jgi:hypothetical protein